MTDSMARLRDANRMRKASKKLDLALASLVILEPTTCKRATEGQ